MDVEGYKTGKDPKEKMGIGLISEVKDWLKDHSIIPSKIESEIVDGYKVFNVDVEGDVVLEGYTLEDVANIPKYIKFKNVTGNFILTGK